MKKIKLIFVSFCTILLLIISGCSSLEITDEMRSAMDLYKQAVSLTEQKNTGTVKFESITDDNALEFKKTSTSVHFNFEVVDGTVKFDRTDYTDGSEVAKYVSDGTSVKSYDYNADVWNDVTELHSDFLKPQSNPFITLNLFRIDNKLRIREDYLTDIKTYTENELTVVEFKLKDKTVSDVFDFYKADGIVRESAGHTRSYYINDLGIIEKVIIKTSQEVISNGVSGNYDTLMTVICE